MMADHDRDHPSQPIPDYDDDYETESRSYVESDIFDNYTFQFDPVLQLKAKWSWEDYRLAAAANLRTKPTDQLLVLSVKPADRESTWWRKLRVTPGNQGLSLYSRRLHLGYLDLQLEAHSNVNSRFALSWRLFPKWSVSRPKLSSKFRRAVGNVPGLEYGFNVHCDLSLPELTGGVGGASSQQRPISLQSGYGHVAFPKLVLIWDESLRDHPLLSQEPADTDEAQQQHTQSKQRGLAIRELEHDSAGPMV